MITVPEVARRVGCNPETVRRWIREGKLPARKIGTQHVVDEDDLMEFLGEREQLPVHEQWRTFRDGTPQPNWVALLHRSRMGR